jgi:FkbM family methyltransferase
MTPDPPRIQPKTTTRRLQVQHPWPMRVLRTLQFGWARLASSDGYVCARAASFDACFTGPAADVITRHAYRLGVHEPAVTRYLIEHVRLHAGEIALDVGANLGWYSILLSRLSEPGARIFAFEPDPETYRLLLRNLQANGAAVEACNFALGESAGTAQLHRYKRSNNGRHTLLSGNASGGIVRVPVHPLSTFWERAGLGARPIRLMKVDVEGFEYFVLRGAGELLRRCACLVLEYNPGSLPSLGLKSQLLTELLAASGLEPHVFVGNRPLRVTFAELLATTSQRNLLLTRPAGSQRFS